MLIDIISPSGSHLDLPGFDKACERLQSLGYALHVRAPREPWQRFGGNDEARLAMIHDAAKGPANVVMLTRGGYGLSRLLDRIDWSLIASAVARGQKWMGYSDFTTFQCALLAKTGAHSFTGPTVTSDFSPDELDVLTLMSFQAGLRGAVPLVQWDMPLQTPLAAVDSLTRHPVRGLLWGGNATMIANLVGTPYLPQLAKPGILWLEEVGDHPYRVERLLHQLFFAGILQKQVALLFGSVTQWKPAPHDNGYNWEAVLHYWRERLPQLLMLDGLPFGHQPTKTVLEFGRPYRLSVSGQSLSLLPD